jgi:hypothetical protein
MKLHLKYIVTLVITALVCIFAYQAYWLVGLYQSQEKEVEAKIKDGMEYAHFMEMKKRIERLRNDDKGPHRQLTGAVAFSMDEDDDIDQKVKVKKVRGGKVVQSVQTTFTKQEKRSEDDKDQELMMMMSGKLATMVQQALFGKLNEIAKPDINDYDSAWVAKMLSDSLLVGDNAHPLPHQIQLFAGKKVLAKVTTEGYVPSDNAKQYQYVVCNEGEANEEKYVLTLEPLTMTVLSQMAGILATSLFIMLILAFVFWFLIHTMLKQKTLDEMKSDFTNNITHELKTPIISEMLGAYLGKLPRPIIQHLHHLSISSLLRRKNISRPVFTAKRIGNIRSQHETAFPADFLPVVAHRLEHSDAAIGCGAATQAHDETAHAPAISIHNHLAHAPGSSLHRVALFRLDQSQSGGLRNLDNRRIIHDSVFSLNPSHQRIMGMNPHSLSLHRREKSIKHSLSPITHFQGNDFGRSIF